MTYDFVINDDAIVNEYGYRVMTDGIDTVQYERNPIVLYMHNRAFFKPQDVVGKCVKLRKDGSKLIASVTFDSDDESAKVLEGKVERGYINMASISADPKATSHEDAFVLKGQTYETVTQCKLVEISIVDIGGNDNALKLQRSGERLELKKINQIKNKTTMSLSKMLGISLGKKDASEDVILGEVQTLKLAKEAADQKVIELTKKLEAIEDKQSVALVDKAIQLGLFSEALKDAQMQALKSDFATQSVVLSKLIAEKEATEKQSNPQMQNEKLKAVILGKSDASQTENSFDYLQKHDPIKLAKIKAEEPKTYQSLVKDYAAGKRHQTK